MCPYPDKHITLLSLPQNVQVFENSSREEAEMDASVTGASLGGKGDWPRARLSLRGLALLQFFQAIDKKSWGLGPE